MKKIAPYLVVFLFLLVSWEMLTDHGGMAVDFHLDPWDGPLDGLLGLMLAGGGLVISVAVALVVALVVTVVCAGLGVLAVLGVALLVIVVLAAISPLLLPLLIPIGIVWYLASRNRKARAIEHKAV